MCIYPFKKLPNYFPKWLYHFTSSPAMCECSSSSVSSQFTTFCLDYSHSSGCEAVSHCGLSYISLVTDSVELRRLIRHACVCLVKCLFKSFVYFSIIFFKFSLKCSLYTLDTSLLSDKLFAVFSPNMWLVFSVSSLCLLKHQSFQPSWSLIFKYIFRSCFLVLYIWVPRPAQLFSPMFSSRFFFKVPLSFF